MIDLSIPVTIKNSEQAVNNEKMVSFGHLGTHFDVMDLEFPLEYTSLEGIVFNVKDKVEIGIPDIDINLLASGQFVTFYSGFIDTVQYGTKRYFTEHPYLTKDLLETLLNANIAIIGIDFAGVRRGKEHTPMDKYCADRGVFIIENLCNLDKILEKSAYFSANIYPVNFKGMSGLPCRVTGSVD